MAERSNRETSRASQEATNWLILLQDEPDNPDLRCRFQAWLAADPGHEAAWAATERTAEILAGIQPRHGGAWKPAIAAMRSRQGDDSTGRGVPMRRRPAASVVLAGLLAASLAAVLLLQAWPLPWAADYRTGTGETRTVTLSDGSTIALAPDSAIGIVSTTSERRVDLLAGDAFFSVAHDPAHPFLVVMGPVRAIDIGTAFEARRDGEGATVAVERGLVRVDIGAASGPPAEILGAGQRIRVSWTGETVRGERPPAQIAAWRRHQLIAEDQSVRAVVDRLRPYFKGVIVLTPSAPADRPITGIYNLADPVEALRGIAQAQGARVHRITPWLLVMSGR